MSETVENTEQNPEAAEPTEAEAPKNPAVAEAKKYRLQLREVEAKLTEMEARVANYQRAEVLSHASALSEPGDLLALSGKDVSAFLSESGDVLTPSVCPRPSPSS